VKDSNSLKTHSVKAVLLILMVVLLWIASWVLIPLCIEKPADRGYFGEQFGAVNALFSGFAFAGIIYTIYIQRKEF